ncbi:polymeric immunoglobulin receptor-like [Colossoma macropomum]|uniref:polymeric immunoglobulin receptor-like n=1 Tax=Colossoma macropomum TaxID=42526 RepID=UPI001864494D|nr:polymeric immunoglobulin receptor-like [Colossoma macropomum]
MKILLIFPLFLISVGGGESEGVTGYSGGGVLIKCTYERQYTSNQKYFCKGSWLCMSKQIWADTKNKWINSGRFSLFDDTRAAEFWVLIRELTVEDSGLYQCGVEKKGLPLDVYTPVELKVQEDHEKSIRVTGHVGGSVNISYKYPKSHSSDPKFLCRRVGTADCSYETSVKESRRWIKEGKLYLHDDGKQIFTVNINNLTEGDSGEYWCGAESDWTSDHGYKDLYHTDQPQRTASPSTSPSSPTAQTIETNASTTTTMKSSFKTSTEILPQSSTYISALTTKPTTSSTPKTKPSSLSVSYVVSGVSVIVLLLLIGLLFFLVTLRKRGKTQDPGTTQGQSFKGFSAVHRVFHLFNNYEEIKDSRHLPTSDAGVFTIYSTSQLPINPSEPSQTDYENVQLPTNPSEPSQTDYENVQLPTNPTEPSQTDYDKRPVTHKPLRTFSN